MITALLCLAAAAAKVLFFATVGGTYDLGLSIITPGGPYPFNLKTLPQNCVVKWLTLQVQCYPYASGAYTFKNSAPTLAAEGGDDVDLVLAAIIKSLDIIVGPSQSCASAISMYTLRTILAYMNGQDFQAPANATAVPHTGGVGNLMTFQIQIPLGLPGIMSDFTIFDQGALRFAAAGQLNINFQSVTTGNFTGTFADGATTFTIPQATTQIRLSARTQVISAGPGMCAALWNVNFPSGAPTTGLTKPGIHLGLFDQTGQPEYVGNGYSATGYNVMNGTTQLAQNNSPAQLIANFIGDRVMGYAVNMTARGTPMVYYPTYDVLANVDQSGSAVNYQVTETGSATLNLLELVMIPPSAADLQDVAQRVGGGGDVAFKFAVPKSCNGKMPSSPAGRALLPVLIYPASSAPAGLPTASPAALGQAVSNLQAQQVQAAKVAQPLGQAGKSIVARGRK